MEQVKLAHLVANSHENDNMCLVYQCNECSVGVNRKEEFEKVNPS